MNIESYIYHLLILNKMLKFKEYFIIGRYKNFPVVIFKEDLVKGFYIPKVLK